MSGPTISGTKELLARLVAFDTTRHKSNLAIQSFIEDYLTEHGIASRLVVSEDGEKANLFATIGPSDSEGGVALSGHTDVVPVTGQDWDTDPFVLTERNGRLYGRGTTDMKGFLASVLAAVPEFARRRLKVPIHIAFSYDEEIGCVGVRPMIARLGHTLPRPRMVFVGEPTGMTVVDAHKGPVRWNVSLTGRSAHSSMAHLGVNAIYYAGRLMEELGRIEAQLKAGTTNDRFDPPFATLQVTEIAGGTASNIVPVTCQLGFEVRATPGLDIDAIEARLQRFIDEHCLPDMRAVAPEADIEISRSNYVPPFGADPASEVVSLAMKLAGQNTTHAVSYATEAGLFQDAQAPAVVCGPGHIAQAHTANEWIAISELEKCDAFLIRLAEWAENA